MCGDLVSRVLFHAYGADPGMKRAAVIGSPVSHSRSPAIFRFLAGREGVKDFSYSATEVKPELLSTFISTIKADSEFIGLNVTIPHKEAVLPYLDSLSSEARSLGAVNVVRKHQERIEGHNTDVIGIIRTLDAHRCRVEGEDAWIWGAGGAARAVAYSLGERRARCVHVFNRDHSRAQSLVAQLESRFPSTRFRASRSPDDTGSRPLSLLVNATPLGMKGVPVTDLPTAFPFMDALPVTRYACAFDLVYVPEHTPFLSRAEELGIFPIGGLGMLVDQAIATWELWFGSLQEPVQSREALMAHLQEMLHSRTEDSRPIFLTGFMGVGKSTVAQSLGQQLGWDCVDTDHLIAQEAGMSIPRIFELEGEIAFREREAQAVTRCAGLSHSVVALGGGAITDPKSLELILRSGHLVFLSADPGALEERLKRTAHTRPLLSGLSPAKRMEKIQSLLVERLPLYQRASLRVSTDGRSPQDVAAEVMRSLP